MEINDHVLKLTGKSSLLEPLELGHEYTLQIIGEITATTDTNNENGTKDRYYKFSPILCDVIDNKGLVIKAQFKSSVSKQIRSSLKGLTNTDTSHNLDPDLIYEEYGKWFQENKHNIYERLLKRVQERN